MIIHSSLHPFRLLITFVVPLLVTLAIGGRSASIYNMTKFLHGLNEKDDCNIIRIGFESWCKVVDANETKPFGHNNVTKIKMQTDCDEFDNKTLSWELAEEVSRNETIVKVIEGIGSRTTAVYFDMSDTVKRA